MSDPQTKTHLDAMETFPMALKRQIQGVGEDLLRRRPAANEWSIVEIIGHIMDVESLWAGRIRQMLSSEHPTLAPYDPDAVVQQRDFQNKLAAGMLISFSEKREEHLTFLRGLRPILLARTGIHPIHGEISVADGIRLLAEHDRKHSTQIAANLEQ